MNINPNLKNPLALFALCFVVIESIFVALLMYRVENIVLCPCLVRMLLIFIIAFPSVVFMGVYVLLLIKPEVLFSPSENAIARYIINTMTTQEKQNNDKAKNERYGSIFMQSNTADTDSSDKKLLTEMSFSVDAILDKYIVEYAPFLKKDVKVKSNNSVRYFDAYAYWNGCHYAVEIKRISKWTASCLNGVRLFSSNARNYFSPLHMTFILQIVDSSSDKAEIAKEIHDVDASINVVFAYEENGVIKYSNIY